MIVYVVTLLCSYNIESDECDYDYDYEEIKEVFGNLKEAYEYILNYSSKCFGKIVEKTEFDDISFEDGIAKICIEHSIPDRVYLTDQTTHYIRKYEIEKN